MNANNDLEFERIEFIHHAENLRQTINQLLQAIDDEKRLDMKQFNVTAHKMIFASHRINSLVHNQRQKKRPGEIKYLKPGEIKYLKPGERIVYVGI